MANRTLPPGVTAGRRGRPTHPRSAEEIADIRRAANRQIAALKGRDTRRRRKAPPPPPPPPFRFWRLPDDQERLWRWLLAQRDRPVWATTICDGSGGEVHITHLWEKGGWRADWVLRRAYLSNGGNLQEFFGDQARDQQVSPCNDPIIGVTVGRVARVRRVAA